MFHPLITYSFVLTFDGKSTISKLVVSFEIDEAKKQFTITFTVPREDRKIFTEEINSFTYFYLDEVTVEGNTTYSEVYHVDKILKKHRKYDYSLVEAVTLTLIGTYK